MKAYDASYSKPIREHEYKDKDNNKDDDNDKDTDKVPDTSNICYILEILMPQAFQVRWWIPPYARHGHPFTLVTLLILANNN